MCNNLSIFDASPRPFLLSVDWNPSSSFPHKPLPHFIVSSRNQPTMVPGQTWPTHLFLSIKFYWNTPLLILFVYGCLSATKAVLNSCSRNHMAVKPKIVIIWPFTEKVWQPLIYTNSPGFASCKVRISSYKWKILKADTFQISKGSFSTNVLLLPLTANPNNFWDLLSQTVSQALT